MPAPQTQICHLETCGVIAFTGPDTDKLLQGQLTCDIQQLTPEQPLAGALCTVKGRMISNLYLFRSGDSVLMALRLELLEATLNHLRKYAVFYKTDITDASEQYRVIGLAGPQEQGTAPTPPLVLAEQLGLTVLPVDIAVDLLSQAGDHLADIHAWYRAAIANGIGEVRGETSEEFIPQMLNFQHTGAVNFRKGCYTGQEIVARMQYLGKLKRRMYRLEVSASELPANGADIQLAEGSTNVGHVVMAESTENGVELLAVLTAEAAASDQLTIAGNTMAVHQLPLPYGHLFDTDAQ